MQQIIAIAIRLKNVGTYGDEIADLLAPPQAENIPPQARAILTQLQAQLHAAMGELQQLRAEKAGKVVEMQGKMALADKQQETQLLVAEVNTKAQNASDREQDRSDMIAQWHDQAHDVAMAATQQQADAQQQQQAQQAQAAQAQQQQAAAPEV
jgi:hypothetical protein